jgi:hypothetical protein
MGRRQDEKMIAGGARSDTCTRCCFYPRLRSSLENQKPAQVNHADVDLTGLIISIKHAEIRKCFGSQHCKILFINTILLYAGSVSWIQIPAPKSFQPATPIFRLGLERTWHHQYLWGCCLFLPPSRHHQ